MRTILTAIHGILTNQTNASWPDRLDAWMFEHAPEVKVLKKEYWAGPFPRVNCLLKDPWLARALANEIELFVVADEGVRPDVWFVAHSNGAVIALLTAKRLIERGHKVAGVILTGAACEPDITRNHIQEWLETGMLGCAIAYISPEDEALPFPTTNVFRRIYNMLAQPYGALGRTGWMADGQRVDSGGWSVDGDKSQAGEGGRLITRSFEGGHGTYFAYEHIEGTFEQVLSDIGEFSTKRRRPNADGLFGKKMGAGESQ